MMDKNERIYYLDSLRAFIMSMGVILHAGMFDRFWFSDGVSYASGLFRMKLFVFIAGFFAVMLYDRRGFKALSKERMLRFGLPCALFILLVNPVANFYMFQYFVNPISLSDYFSTDFRWPAGTTDRINWHLHLWFLIVALVYCMALPIFLSLATSRPVLSAVNWLDPARGRPSLRLFMLAIAMTLLFAGTRTLHFLLFYPYLKDGPLNFLVQAILWYTPYFMLGILAFRHRPMFYLLHRPVWWHVLAGGIVLGCTVVAYPLVRQMTGRAPAELVQHLGEGFAGFWLCCLLLSLFSRRFNGDSRIVRFISDASYTVYLFHFSLIAIGGYYISRLNVGPLATYVATIVLVYVGCLLIHLYVVESGPLPRLVFNGKRPLRKPVDTGSKT